MKAFPSWIYRQSAVLPYRRRDNDTEVLLVTARGGQRWVLPKGIVDPGLSAPASAAKEAREEAGVVGAVSERALGRYRQDKWNGTCRIDVFPMRVTSELEAWPEADVRRRAWLPLEKALKRVKDKKLRKILRGLPERIALDTGGDAEPVATEPDGPRLIYLLRHAKSSWDDPSLEDFDRPLAARGRKACETLHRYMELADVEPDLVLCSSSVRTRETLAGIQPALGEGAKLRFDKQIYLGGPQALLTRLRRAPESVRSTMMIGHDPALQTLASQLAGKGDKKGLSRMAAKFPTGALATLVVEASRWQDLGPETCSLHSFVTPRELP